MRVLTFPLSFEFQQFVIEHEATGGLKSNIDNWVLVRVARLELARQKRLCLKQMCLPISPNSHK